MKRWATIGMLSSLLALTAIVNAGPAQAAPVIGVKTCSGNGSVLFTPSGPGASGPVTWTVRASGICEPMFFPPSPLETVQLSGTGTSTTLGLCTGSLILVENLLIHLSVIFTDATTGKSTTTGETWSAPISTFPAVTPYLVSADGGGLGGGVMFSHIFLQCGNGVGQPSASFDWVQTP